MQTLCAKASSNEGKRTVVEKGNMTVGVSPPSVERGSTASMTISAKDADMGSPITGAQVFLNGRLVGQTGVPFTFSPELGQANPAGVVKEPVAHNDASFTITLINPPPKPRGKLYLNVGPTVLIPNTLRLVSATWIVTTVWTPTQNFAGGSPNTYMQIPHPPPAPADPRLSVVLETRWEVAGRSTESPSPINGSRGT